MLKFKPLQRVLSGIALLAALPLAAQAQGKEPVKVGLVSSKSGVFAEQGEEGEHGNLRGEGFRGGDSDLLPGAQIDPAIAFPADRAEGIVANAKGRRAPAAAFAQGG